MELFARLVPRAQVRRLAGRDHQLNNRLSEVAIDIRRLDQSSNADATRGSRRERVPPRVSSHIESMLHSLRNSATRFRSRRLFVVGLGVRLVGLVLIWAGDGSAAWWRKVLVVIGVVLSIGGIAVLRYLLLAGPLSRLGARLRAIRIAAMCGLAMLAPVSAVHAQQQAAASDHRSQRPEVHYRADPQAGRRDAGRADGAHLRSSGSCAQGVPGREAHRGRHDAELHDQGADQHGDPRSLSQVHDCLDLHRWQSGPAIQLFQSRRPTPHRAGHARSRPARSSRRRSCIPARRRWRGVRRGKAARHGRPHPMAHPWIDTSLWGGGCDLLYPCLDHPTLKPATTDLHYTVPTGLMAPGNGALVSKVEKDGWTTWNWHARSIHTYGSVLNVGPYKVLEGDYKSRFGNTIPMRLYYIPGEEKDAADLFSEFPQTLDFWENVIGPYPWADQKMGVVRVPFSGLENQTLIGHSGPYTKTAFGWNWLLNHEFAHEWFANQLSNANYDDLWLHEGLGSYAQPLIAEYLGGELDYMAQLRSQRNGHSQRTAAGHRAGAFGEGSLRRHDRPAR